MKRKLSRRKRTAVWVAGIGIATGTLAMILWPRIRKMLQQPMITVGKPTITPKVEVYDLDLINQLPYWPGT